jgi:hypothetical protein
LTAEDAALAVIPICRESEFSLSGNVSLRLADARQSGKRVVYFTSNSEFLLGFEVK